MVESVDIIENALEIPVASSDSLVMDDYRRLTGPGLLWNRPGAILDIFYSGFDPDVIAQKWHHHARNVLDAIGWGKEHIIHRHFDVGSNLAISAPMDQLYSAIFAAQTAWHFCAAELLNETAGDFDQMISDVKSVMAREENPPLIALIKAAGEHGVDVLCDDDDLSLGHGIGSQTFSVLDLPKPEDVNWGKLHDVPVAMITGTNGKTTTTRLSAAIGKAAGLVSGLTSTEFVRVGDDILDRGDYSGPGGGRMLLRDQRLETAYLEVARGGILRRGLPLRQAKAAVVLNVANDHLGQFGVNTVEDLAVAKFAVYRTLAEDGVLILNADDSYVVNESKKTDANICWFSLNPETALIQEAKAAGKLCAWYDGTSLIYFDGAEETSIADVADIPLTLNGAARYNISNALAATCLSKAMGISNEAIRKGLASFKNDPKDNPGRCNEFNVKGARVFVDFAHNPHSIEAVVNAMASVPAKKRFITVGHAGDRSDQDIRDVTRSALALKPDRVMAVEMEDYLRGRERGEITDLIRAECLTQGLTDDQIHIASSPAKGVAQILEEIEEGDLALLLILADRDEVFEMLEKHG